MFNTIYIGEAYNLLRAREEILAENQTIKLVSLSLCTDYFAVNLSIEKYHTKEQIILTLQDKIHEANTKELRNNDHLDSLTLRYMGQRDS